jgi:hypothetical protein
MRRRWAVVVAVIVIAAGVTVALVVSSPSHDTTSVEQLLAPDPQLVISTPTNPPPSSACERLSQAKFVLADGASEVGGIVDFTGRVELLSCGTNGARYVARPDTEQFQMERDAPVIKRTLHGPVRMPAGNLPLYLSDSGRYADAARTKFFRFTGSPLNVTKMVELVKP